MTKIYIFLLCFSIIMPNTLNAQNIEVKYSIPHIHEIQLVGFGEFFGQEHFIDEVDPFQVPFMAYMTRNGHIAAVVDTYNVYSVINGVSQLSSTNTPIYNQENVMTGRIFSSRDFTTGVFDFSSDIRFRYDAEGRIIQDTLYSYNRNTGEWVLTQLSEYSFNDDGLNTLTEFFQWNSDSNQWDKFRLFTRQYNENNQITVIRTSDWSAPDQSFETSSESLYEYDELFREIKHSIRSILSGLLQTVWESTIEYSEDGLESVNMVASRSVSNTPLTPSLQRISRFNERGLILNIDFNSFAGFQDNVPTWRLGSRRQHTYDENDFEIENRRFSWDIDAERYILEEITDFNYDEFGNMVHRLVYRVNSANETSLITEETLDLDYNFQSDELLYPFSTQNTATHKILDRVTYNHINQRIQFRQEFIWRVLSTSSTEEIITLSNINIFPNPVMDMLTIQADNDQSQYDFITITDMYGRLMYRNTWNGELRLPVHNWAAGTYVVIFSDQTGKRNRSHQVVRVN
jgi:hypothetical protein